MKNPISAVLLGLCLTFGATVATGATLGLNTGTPTVSASEVFVDFLNDDPFGDLSAFGAVTGENGVVLAALAELGVGVGFDLSDPTSGLTGGFDILDDIGSFLGGDLIAVGFAEDLIELQFGNLTGYGVDAFNSTVLMTIVFDDPANALGANPFDDLVEGFPYEASITIANVTPVPLPAALPLLLVGLAGMGALSRRKKAA